MQAISNIAYRSCFMFMEAVLLGKKDKNIECWS